MTRRRQGKAEPGVTRRGLLGAAAAAGAAACATPPSAPAYAGKVAFKHGVASGDPTQTRVVLWTRVTPESTDAPAPVQWSVSRDAAYKDVVRKGVFTTDAARDWTVKVDVDGLEPGVTYYYWFWVGDTVSRGGKTKTLPASGVASFRLGVVSCSNFPFGYFNAYAELAKRKDIDAIFHAGDYIYEYGVTGYGGEMGKRLGRSHEPPTECVKLADYRMRHAQYKADLDTQAAHAAAPWFCTWDDHETANNSYATGAENHQPDTEGGWEERKAAAIQAYMEWMPVRDPEPGRAKEALYRKFDIGDLATLFLLETRLIARSQDLTFDPIGLAPDNQKQAVAGQLLAKVRDPSRTLMGPEQEAWLADGLKASTAAGRKWQVLGNQVTMAKVKAPDLQKGLGPLVWATIPPGSQRFWTTAKYGFEWNLDSWSGFPAARERLYASAKAANARLVTLTGDTHTAWANELHDEQGRRWGVEFGCTSVTSNGAGDSLPYKELNWLMTEANPDVVYYNAFDKGFTIVTLTADQVEAEFVKVSTIRSPDYFASTDARFTVRAAEEGMGPLRRSMATSPITAG